jgi:NADH:ubiquinone oxidoreductase subunit E
MSHTTARETASNARLESLPLLANGFAIRVWLENRTLETVALNATLASLGLEWVPAKYAQLDMHSLKTARHFVCRAYQERMKMILVRQNVKTAAKDNIKT